MSSSSIFVINMLLLGIQKTVSTRQLLDAQLNENKIVQEVMTQKVYGLVKLKKEGKKETKYTTQNGKILSAVHVAAT